MTGAPPQAPPALRLVERRATMALAGREVVRVLRIWSQTILPPVVTAALFLLIFGGALGGRLREVEGVDYLSFILPGLLVTTVVSQAFANSATSLFQAKYEGYLEDVLTSPLRPWQIVAAYLTGSMVRALLAGALVIAVAAPFAEPIAQPVTLIATLLLTGVIFAALGVVTGVWAESIDQQAFVSQLVITPLALLGGVFYAASSLGEPWRTLTLIDPIYHLVDAARAGYVDTSAPPVWLSLTVAGAVAAVAVAVAVAVVRSGWRLKP